MNGTTTHYPFLCVVCESGIPTSGIGAEVSELLHKNLDHLWTPLTEERVPLGRPHPRTQHDLDWVAVVLAGRKRSMGRPGRGPPVEDEGKDSTIDY